MQNAKTITIGTKNYILKLTSRAQIQLSNKYKKSVMELMDQLGDIEVFADIIAASSLKHCKMTREDALDFIDELVEMGVLKELDDRAVFCGELLVVSGLMREEHFDVMIKSMQDQKELAKRKILEGDISIIEGDKNE